MQSSFSKSLAPARGFLDLVSRVTAPLFPDRTQAILKKAREDQQIAQWVANGKLENGVTPLVPPLVDMMDDEYEIGTYDENGPWGEVDPTLVEDAQRSMQHLKQAGAYEGYTKYGDNPVGIDYSILNTARHEAYLERQERQEREAKSLSQQV